MIGPLVVFRAESGKAGCFSPRAVKKEPVRKSLRLRFSLGKSSRESVSSETSSLSTSTRDWTVHRSFLRNPDLHAYNVHLMFMYLIHINGWVISTWLTELRTFVMPCWWVCLAPSSGGVMLGHAAINDAIITLFYCLGLRVLLMHGFAFYGKKISKFSELESWNMIDLVIYGV